jgi:hypothetical protein
LIIHLSEITRVVVLRTNKAQRKSGVVHLDHPLLNCRRREVPGWSANCPTDMLLRPSVGGETDFTTQVLPHILSFSPARARSPH